MHDPRQFFGFGWLDLWLDWLGSLLQRRCLTQKVLRNEHNERTLKRAVTSHRCQAGCAAVRNVKPFSKSTNSKLTNFRQRVITTVTTVITVEFGVSIQLTDNKRIAVSYSELQKKPGQKYCQQPLLLMIFCFQKVRWILKRKVQLLVCRIVRNAFRTISHQIFKLDL